jgi:hypothetical protein
MAIGLASGMKVQDSFVLAGYTETLAQAVELFNAASNGTLLYETMESVGHFSRETFFKSIGSLIQRRDITSTSALTDTALAMDENVMVKVNRIIGPIANTLDSLRKLGKDERDFSYNLGIQIAKAQVADALNTVVLAAGSVLVGQTALVNDYTAVGAGTLTHTALIGGLAKLGDRADAIKAWVMHSKAYFDLMANALADKVYEVASGVVYQATPGSLNRPVIVTDSPSLVITGSPNTYLTLGLTEGAGQVLISEPPIVTNQVITGQANLIQRLQGEYAYQLGVKGFAWDVTAGNNPTNAALGTAANWLVKATDLKDAAGVVVKTK